MAHLTLEYSANLEPGVDIGALVAAVHDAALATGIFPAGGLRSRAARRDIYRIADGDAANGFVHLGIRVGAGRSKDVRRQAGDAIFAALTAALDSLFRQRPLGISMEIVEIDPAASWKHNNLHTIIAERRRAAGGDTAP